MFVDEKSIWWDEGQRALDKTPTAVNQDSPQTDNGQASTRRWRRHKPKAPAVQTQDTERPGAETGSELESQGSAPHGGKLVVDWWSTEDGNIAHGGRGGSLMGWEGRMDQDPASDQQ